jgi:trans-aconitate methyltransferase
MEILPNARIDNRICEACGLIFNAAGTRGVTREFYRDSYSLMTKSNEAAIQSFHGLKPMSQAERTFELLEKFRELPSSGVILEAGAGKGEFLSLFSAKYPNWKMSAFEPSQSYDNLAYALPQVDTKRCNYFDFDLNDEKADIVVALGVLEHVENPLHMLVWANSQLKDGGCFYIRVPNFNKNPNDLFCADHLSKITVPTIRVLAEAAGFEIEVIEETGVPVFALLLKRSEPSDTLNNAYKENQPIAESNVAVAKGIVESIFACRNAALSCGENFAIFGLASAGLFAPSLVNSIPMRVRLT